MEQSVMEKLTILADSAKYDVACTSSGSTRRSGKAGGLGSCYAPRLLPRLYRRRPVRQPAEGADDQLLLL